MIDATNLLYRIKECPHDDKLYLLEKVPNDGGFFVLNGNFLYVVPNKETCSLQSLKTSYLRLETNVHISAFNVSTPSFGNGYYNYIELCIDDKDDIKEYLSTFVNLCLSYAANANEVNFISFFDALVNLFQIPRDQSHKNLIGLLGELYVIQYVYKELGLDISKYWHSSGSTSQLDFVCPKCNLEVKTTASTSFCFMIKHEQLFTAPRNNYLLAVTIEENNTGNTLNEIIASMMDSPDYCNGLSFAINIEKEKRRILPSNLASNRFLFKSIKAYHAPDINPFGAIPEYVNTLSYKLDLIAFTPTPLEDVFKTEKPSKNITINIGQFNMGNGTQSGGLHEKQQ